LQTPTGIEATKNIALKLLNKGTAIEIIAEVTGLSESSIKRII
jgi:DNA-binding NarL/FixJ family response regulator